MDISNASEPVILPTAKILPEARAPLADTVGPSNRVNAVGQSAKTAVQDARGSGLQLPKNAQGYAASQFARGADPESVFSALVAQTVPTEVDGADIALALPEGDAIVAVDAADQTDGQIATAEDTGPFEAISLIPDDTEGPTPEETALNLLAEDRVA